MRVRPRTLTAKITIRVINGARMRRMIRKTVAEACSPEAIDDARLTRADNSSSRPKSWRQKTSSGLLTEPASASMEGRGLGDQQYDRDQIGQQSATGQGHDGRCGVGRQTGVRYLRRDDPDNTGGQQLQISDQAGGQMDRAELGPIAELQDRGDQADHQGGEQFVDVVQRGIGNIADEEAEVQGRREQDEETEDHLLEIHAPSRPAGPWLPSITILLHQTIGRPVYRGGLWSDAARS